MSRSTEDVVVALDDEGESPQMRHRGDDFTESLPSREKRRTIHSMRRRTKFRKSHRIDESIPEAKTLNSRLGKMTKKFKDGVGADGMWSPLLKSVEKNLGSDVVVYFTQLIWLMYVPVLGLIIVLGFVVSPQLYQRFEVQTPSGYQVNKPFVWHDLFTGRNWLESTELYQGYYEGGVIGTSDYYMPTAYLMTLIAAYSLYLLFLVKSHSDALSQQYVEHDVRRKKKRKNKGDDDASVTAPNVFAAWDYSICRRPTAEVRRQAIREDLLRSLNPQLVTAGSTQVSGRAQRYFFNLGLNVLSFILIVGLCLGVWYVAALNELNSSARSLFAMPLISSIGSMVLPLIFKLFAVLEQYTNRKTGFTISMVRLFILQLGLFTSVVFYLIAKVKCDQVATSGETSQLSPICDMMQEKGLDESGITCWETWVGQEIYRWVITDFVVVIVISAVVLSVRKLLSCCTRFKAPDADVPGLIMHLLLTQGLAWFGIFFCPLLPVVMMIKFLVFFFCFRLLLIYCCGPSSKQWQFRYAIAFFRYFIFFFFIAGFVSVLAAVIVLKPSKTCGPFRNLTAVRDALPGGENAMPKVGPYVELALTFLNSLGFNIFITVCAIVVLLIFRRRAQQKSEALRLLRRTIQMIAKDKVYYLKMLQKNAEKNPYQMMKTLQAARPVRRTPSGHSLGGSGAATPITGDASTTGTLSRGAAIPFYGTPSRGSPAPSRGSPVPFYDTPSRGSPVISQRSTASQPLQTAPVRAPSPEAFHDEGISEASSTRSRSRRESPEPPPSEVMPRATPITTDSLESALPLHLFSFRGRDLSGPPSESSRLETPPPDY